MTTTTDNSIEKALETIYVKKTTYVIYIHRLRRLRDVTVECKTYLDLVSNPDLNYAKIKLAYPNINTRKNMLTTILTLFKNIEELAVKLPDEQKLWKISHDRMDSFLQAKSKKHMPDMKQLAKYTPFEEMELKYIELTKEDPHKTMKDSMQFVLLSIIISTPPKRCDYGSLKVYYDTDPKVQDANYIVINHSDPSYMVFNVYKTSKVYNRVDQDLSIRVTNDIKDSLRRHKREFLFVNRFNKPFANNGFSKYLINMFNIMFGRNTSSSILRHIFITEKVNFDDMDDDELENIAKQMLHSTNLQRKYNWNKKAICSTLKKMCPECD
jgi:hypothetical protein